MFKKLATLLAGAALVLSASSAMATYINPVSGDGAGKDLQSILNNITVGGVSSVVATGPVNDSLAYDKYWKITASGQSAATLVIEVAGLANQNVFGVTDGQGNMVTVFDGPQAAGAKAVMTIYNDGSVYLNLSDTGVKFSSSNFAYFIDNGTNTWYSDDALNSDGADHMVAFRGNNTDYINLPGPGGGTTGLFTNNEYILGFEDLAFSGSDKDYNDMVVMVESVEPVPEPGTMVLLGAGMLGLAIFGKRRMNREA